MLFVLEQFVGLQVVVDDHHRIAVDEHFECGRDVPLRVELDALLAHNGVFAVDGDGVAAVMAHDRVAILVDLRELAADVFLADDVGTGLLQTNDVGPALLDVLDDGIGAVVADAAFGKPAHVIGHHLDGVVGCIGRHVERQIDAQRPVAEQIAHDGNEHTLPVEREPENHESQVDEQKHRIEQARIRQHRVLGRAQPAGHAHQQHDDDGHYIGAGHHLQKKLLQSLQHQF